MAAITEAQPFSLLLVDDHADNREVLAAHLQAAGFSTAIAEDGPEALEMLARGGIDLVLLDVLLPRMTGFEVLRQIRARRAAAELPVIMVTALDRSPDVVAALDQGANDYVTKPLDFPVVIARVKAQLRSRRAVAEPEGGGDEVGPGSVLEGRYRLEAEIGAGTFGSVYRATQLELERAVAVKVLKAGALVHGSAVERFRREAVTGCRVNHPNAVAILDYGVVDGRLPFLVMELLEGRTLAEELKQQPVLSVSRCAGVMAPVCDALEAAHQAGIVHRDVKPANIFLHQATRGETPKVVDFGIAKLVDDAALEQQATVDGWIVGTPSFMAPERFGHGPVDGRTDVYSVGVTLFLALSGRLPFEARRSPSTPIAGRDGEPSSLRALNPGLPEPVDRIVARALQPVPERRPSAGELAVELQSLIEGTVRDDRTA